MDKESIKYVGRQFFIVVVVALLAMAVFAVGLMVGYAVIGDGQQATDILSTDKWQDIIGKFTGK